MLEMEDRKVDTQKAVIHKTPWFRTHPVVCGIVALVLVATVVGSATGFWQRFYYEAENRLTGQVLTSAGTYTGSTDLGAFSGTGAFTFKTGTFYEGTWQKNRMEGEGTLSDPESGTYTGSFSDSQKSGQGTFTWNNGDTYTGNWQEDAMNGEGTYTFADGSVMQGQFQDNAFFSGEYKVSNTTGTYVIQYTDGQMASAEITFVDGTVYNGGFTGGQISGNGTVRYPNGDSYSGSYQQGKREGDGTYRWYFGDTYEGSWSGDAMNGAGSYTFADGMTLSGTFADNQFASGSYQAETEDGTYQFTLDNGKPVTAEIRLKNGLFYTGGFSDKGFDGEGKVTYPTGDSYDGNFSEGLREGQGTYHWADGSYYTGAWEQDAMDGEGTYYYPANADGYKLEGTFSEGKPNGSCHYYQTELQYYVTDWDHGICTKVTE